MRPEAASSPERGLRLQRLLAQAGVASRRKAEQLILAGRVAVNGQVVRELGRRVDPRSDRVECDGQRVTGQQAVWLLLNKPKETVSTVSDPEGRKTVLDLVGDQPARLFPVGRLDYHTEGVLLLTNDGGLAQALMHPRHRVARVYHVKLKGLLSDEDLEPLRVGVWLDGEKCSAPTRLIGHTSKHTWVEMTLHRGLNRQIHRMVEQMGGVVIKLIRVSFAGLIADGLRVGEHRRLAGDEIDALRLAVGYGGARAKRRRPTRRATI